MTLDDIVQSDRLMPGRLVSMAAEYHFDGRSVHPNPVLMRRVGYIPATQRVSANRIGFSPGMLAILDWRDQETYGNTQYTAPDGVCNQVNLLPDGRVRSIKIYR